ncbi:MAG: hypothetical protein WBZ51_06915, partial [Xanthobacteraceae bacterium]
MEPRGIKRADAAKYCGISPATFSRWISVGIMPRSIPGTRVWDRVALDRALDKVSAVSITASREKNEVENWFEKEESQNA